MEFALSVELETVSSVMFASLAANTSSGFTPGGYTALPNLIGSPIMNPSGQLYQKTVETGYYITRNPGCTKV